MESESSDVGALSTLHSFTVERAHTCQREGIGHLMCPHIHSRQDDASPRLHTVTGVDMDTELVFADDDEFHSRDLHYVQRRKVKVKVKVKTSRSKYRET